MTRVAVLVVLLASRATAHADVHWDAPEGCPSAETVRAAIAAQLGRAVEPGDVEVELKVARDGDRWRVDLTAGGGVRTLDAASCDELAEAAALIVAMTIDEAAQATPPPDEVDGVVDEDPPPPVITRREIDVSDRTDRKSVV